MQQFIVRITLGMTQDIIDVTVDSMTVTNAIKIAMNYYSEKIHVNTDIYCYPISIEIISIKHIEHHDF